MNDIALSVIVPCFNEEESLPLLIEQLLPELESATRGSWELVLVDDGSSDGTARSIWALHQRSPRIKGVRLSRNFGHQPAIMAGLHYASGACVAIIDCDLQDPVRIMLAMYDRVRHGGCDVCFGVRAKREAPLWLRVCYRAYYRLIRVLAEHDWPLDSGDFSVFNARVKAAILAMPEATPVLRGLRAWVGFRQEAFPYDRPSRALGQSKYNIGRLAMLAINSLVSFSVLPLRMATLVGGVMFLITCTSGAFFLINRLNPEFTLFGYFVGVSPGTATLLIYISMIASMLFLCIGILGEYLALIVREVKKRPTSIVAEVTSNPECQEASR